MTTGRRRIGGPATTSATRALGHINALMTQCPGLTSTHIMGLAGLPHSTYTAMRKSGRITVESEERILAVTERHVALCPPMRVPSRVAREHLDSLLAETGLPMAAIERASGFCKQTIRGVMRGRSVTIERRIHVVLVGLTADDLRAVNRWEDRRPTLTRLRALQANGWGLARLSEMYGGGLTTVVQEPLDKPVTTLLARRVKAIYDEIGDAPGGSARAANLARGLGFMPPIYYDDNMDLIEVEEEDSETERQREARIDLCILGQTLENRGVPQITTSLGTTERRVSRVRRECGLTMVRTYAGDYEPREDAPGIIAAIRRVVARVHYRSTLDVLDEPDLDYVALLRSVRKAADLVAA